MTLLFGVGGKKGVLPHPLRHMPVHRHVNRRVLRLQPPAPPDPPAPDDEGPYQRALALPCSHPLLEYALLHRLQASSPTPPPGRTL